MVFKTFRPFFPTIEKTASFYAPYQFANIDKLPLDEVEFIMSQIHGKKLAAEVISDLSAPQNIFQHYDFPTCFNCENCKIEKNCRYFEILRIEKKVNEMSVKNKISYKQILKL